MDEITSVQIEGIVPVNDAQKAALARLYADKELVSYLNRVIQAENQGMIKQLNAGKYDNARYHANRITIVQGLIRIGKDSFAHMEQLKPKSQVVQ